MEGRNDSLSGIDTNSRTLSNGVDCDDIGKLDYEFLSNIKQNRTIGGGGVPVFKFNCTECLFGCPSILALEKHRRNHEVPSRFRCEICSYSSSALHKVEAHQLGYHHRETNVTDADSNHAQAFINKPSFITKIPDRHTHNSSHVIELPDSPEESQVPDTSMDSNGVEMSVSISAPRSSDNLFHCNECSYNSTHEASLHRHRAHHQLNGSVKCPLCSFSASYIMRMHSHISSCHPDVDAEAWRQEVDDSSICPPGSDGLFHCHECAYVSTHEANLRRHRAHHLLNGPAKCPLCTFSASSSTRILVHVSSFHPDTDTEAWRQELDIQKVWKESDDQVQSSSSEQQDSLRCSVCRANHSTAFELNQHCALHHPKTLFVQCQHCPKLVLSARGLKIHCKKVHGVSTDPNKDDSLNHDLSENDSSLADLDELSDTSSLLKNDSSDLIRNNKETKTIVVDDDIHVVVRNDRARVRDVTLHDHAYDSHPAVPQSYQCPCCSFVSQSLSLLEHHASEHEDARLYACLYCSFICVWGYDMEVHIRGRHQKKVSQVGDANLDALVRKCFQQRVNVSRDGGKEITKHLRTTSQDDSVFKLERDNSKAHISELSNPVVSLSDHVDGSTVTIIRGRKLWSCLQCTYTSRTKDSFVTHLSTHENLRRFVCATCGLRANDRCIVEKHMKTVHKGCPQDVVELSEEVARQTIDKYISTKKGVSRWIQEDMRRGSSKLGATKIGGSLKEDTGRTNILNYVSYVKAKCKWVCRVCQAQRKSLSAITKHFKVHAHNDTFFAVDNVVNKNCVTSSAGGGVKERQGVFIKSGVSESLSPTYYSPPPSGSNASRVESLRGYHPLVSPDKGGEQTTAPCTTGSAADCVDVNLCREGERGVRGVLCREGERGLREGGVLTLVNGQICTQDMKKRLRWSSKTAVTQGSNSAATLDIKTAATLDITTAARQSRKTAATLDCNTTAALSCKIEPTLDVKTSATLDYKTSATLDYKTSAAPDWKTSSILDCTKERMTFNQYLFGSEPLYVKKVETDPIINLHSSSTSSLASTPSSHNLTSCRYNCQHCTYKTNHYRNMYKHTRFSHCVPALTSVKEGGREHSSISCNAGDHNESDRGSRGMKGGVESDRSSCGTKEAVVVNSVGNVASVNGEDMMIDLDDVKIDGGGDGTVKRNSGTYTECRGVIRSNLNSNSVNNNSNNKGTVSEGRVKVDNMSSSWIDCSSSSDNEGGEEEKEVQHPPLESASDHSYNEGRGEKKEIQHPPPLESASDHSYCASPVKHSPLPCVTKKVKQLKASQCSFTCKICPYQCRDRVTLSCHMKLHTKRAKYKFVCTLCPYYAPTGGHLRRHILSHVRQQSGGVTSVDTSVHNGVRTSSHDKHSTNRVNLGNTVMLHDKRIAASGVACDESVVMSDKDVNRRSMPLRSSVGHEMRRDEEYVKCDIVRGCVAQSSGEGAVQGGANIQGDALSDAQSGANNQGGMQGGANIQGGAQSGANDQGGAQSGADIQVCAQGGVDNQGGAQSGSNNQGGAQSGADDQRDIKKKDELVNSLKSIVLDCPLGGTVRVSEEVDYEIEESLEKQRLIAEKRGVPWGSRRGVSGNRGAVMSVFKDQLKTEDVRSIIGSTSQRGPLKRQHSMPDNDVMRGTDSGSIIDGFIPPSTVQQILGCVKCPYQTRRGASDLTRHAALHGSRQRYTCDCCDYSVGTAFFLSQHRRLHLESNPNLLLSQSLNNLQLIPQVDEKGSRSKVTSSDSHNASKIDTSKLFENSAHYVPPSPLSRVLRCDRCPFTSAQRETLLAHLRNHSSTGGGGCWGCPFCDYSSPLRTDTEAHVVLHFNIPGSEMNVNNSLNPTDPVTVGFIDAFKKMVIDRSLLISQASSVDNTLPMQPPSGNRTLPMQPPSADGTLPMQPPWGEHRQSGTRVVRDISNNISKDLDMSEKKDFNVNQQNSLPTSLCNGIESSSPGISSGSGTPTVVPSLMGKPSLAQSCAVERQGSGGSRWICRYCDRIFEEYGPLERHESAHLHGHGYQRY